MKSRIAEPIGKVALVATLYAHLHTFHIPTIKQLQGQGLEVHVFACPDKFKRYLAELGCACHEVHFRRSPFRMANIFALIQLIKAFKQERFDFIHAHTPVGGVLSRLAARWTRTPVLYTAHGFHFFQGGPWLNWLIYYPVEKWLSRWTDALITINEHDYAVAERMMGKKRPIYRLQGMGVDRPRWQGIMQVLQQRWRNRAWAEGPVILTVGELNRNKNHKQVIRAPPLLVGIYPNIQYIIVGEGVGKTLLEKEVCKCGVKGRVYFEGFSENLEIHYANADVFVLPSYREGLGLAAVEAMTCGLPVIMTPTSGGRSLVEDGKNGYLVDFDDSGGMAQAIDKVLRNRETLLEMGKASNVKSEPYSEKYVLGRLDEIHRTFLARGKNKYGGMFSQEVYHDVPMG